MLAGDVCCDAAWALGRRGVARFAHERGSVVLPLHDAADMLPVDRVASSTPVLAVAIEPPPGVHRAARLLGRLLARWELVTAALLLTLIAGLFIGPRTQYVCFGETKGDIAKLTVKKYAFEAYPQWRREHPSLECPRSLRALDGYMDHADQRDPWGRAYVFTCGGGKLYVASLGYDGRANTADDIWSNQ